jgi:death-on-curing protein
MKARSLTVVEIEYVAHRLAQELLSWHEPIPEFSTRFPGRLEGCLAAPFQRFSGNQLYEGTIGKASILFYLMVKNHPFQNGNKRIAMTATFYFLSKNDKWLRVDQQELYNFAKWVAESNPKLKDETVKAIEKFIKTYIVDA